MADAPLSKHIHTRAMPLRSQCEAEEPQFERTEPVTIEFSSDGDITYQRGFV